MPPLQQADFQLQNAQVLTNLNDESPTTTRKPTKGKTVHHSPMPISHNSSSGNNHHQPLASNSVRPHHYHHHHSKHDDHAEFHRSPSQNGPSNTEYSKAIGGSTSASHDNYDTVSTESTPSQIHLENPQANGSRSNESQNSKQSGQFATRQSNNNRRNVNRQHSKNDENQPITVYGDHLDEPVDLVDDIHTTRSSLAAKGNHLNDNNNSDGNYNGNSGSGSNANQNTLATASHLDQSTPSLAMHGPYGVTPPSIGIHQNQLNQFLAQHQGSNKIEPPILDTDDMMTSYSRILSGGNLTDSMLRDYNLAALSGSNSSNLLANFFGGSSTLNGDGATQESGNAQSNFNHLAAIPKQRAHSVPLPFSVLLSDLLKLTRPSTPLVNTQANFEQPTNSRTQHGILQQLRSLPGPLLSLLQGSSFPSNTNHELGSSSNHDASESSQHYQRISMLPTEMHSILTRSLRSSGGVLPAYSAPIGTPQTWIPPTSGGSSAMNDGVNSNADFIASNTAGFVRATGQRQQQQAGSQLSNEQVPYQHHEQNYQRSVMTQEISNHQPIDGGTSQQQQQNQFINIDNGVAGNSGQFGRQSSSLGQAVGNSKSQQTNDMSTSSLDAGRRIYKPNVGEDSLQQVNQIHSQQPQALGTPLQSNPQVPRSNSQINQAPSLYNLRSVSEMPVPLGYNPTQAQQINPQQSNVQGGHQQRRPFDFNLPIESAPKASITSSVAAPMIGNKQQQNNIASKLNQAPVIQQSSVLANVLNRQKRETSPGDNEPAASRDNPNEEEEFLDSRPISIVRPDGKPMNSDVRLGRSQHSSKTMMHKRLENQLTLRDKQVGDNREYSSPSQHKMNHLDFDALHHYASAQDGHNKMSRYNNSKNGRKKTSMNESSAESEFKKGSGTRNKKPAKYKNKFKTANDKRENVALDTAGSGLMSKLLGTASTNDELEEDIDADDEDSANEKRKDELDDAEFGIVNDERSNGPTSEGPVTNSVTDISNSSPLGNEASRLQNGGGDNADSSLGSGSTDNEAYARKHQQRSDIEFYGHPGEETRQLKYGILGSGNYEVVNGGIYPEADESTAAVNSVANYVRKPGLLVAGLPKLIATGHGPMSSAQAAFMPGGRIGGFLRGASANPEDLVGLLPTSEAGDEKGLSSPLLDLIDANGGHLFDPNLVAHLGSSGTSTRTTHASQDDSEESTKSSNKVKPLRQDGRNHGKRFHDEQDDNGEEFTSHLVGNSNKTKMKQRELEEQNTRLIDNDRHALNDYIDENHHRKAEGRQKSRSNGSKSQGTNQFNSYQILPSKKVTIFSDQDLDSAPNEPELQFKHHMSADWSTRMLALRG